jgi:phage shock protein E
MPQGTWVQYALLLLAATLVGRKIISGLAAKRRIPALLAQGAAIIDVRSPSEFSAAHATGSRNIPLGEIDQAAKNFNTDQWIILCCASGTRSGMARRKLMALGFAKVLNAGSWRNLP